MKCRKEDMLLYAVTDSTWLNGRSLASVVEEAILGGATFVQLREKELDEEAFIKEAYEVKEVCKKYGVPFVINDNVKIAKIVDADGVHVGQSDMEAGNVREILGPDKIIGVSCKTAEQARLAQSRGADYLGCGAMYATNTKSNAITVTRQALKEVCAAVEIPVVAIGGLNLNNLDILEDTGLDGIAVVSAIFAKEDVKAAAAQMKEAITKIVNA